MLASASAADCEGTPHQAPVVLIESVHVRGVADVQGDERMEVSVADVAEKTAPDLQLVHVLLGLDEHFAQTADGHADVCGDGFAVGVEGLVGEPAVVAGTPQLVSCFQVTC